ncbi:PQQ-dependent sugar dehydrogenase [Histidinibacterium lentulum]|uniref:PQQ-dependent sugar dehydrogenase n=1 Tax=Histidinibacterium lentulum TaxID=2480588 RepID=A0A3N2R6F2_9RHOB|nr:PQQ-dependent sugar dehydrogenase [Histidinibacterium lentulum]ROU03014.1 PQQ-dependent sugar dehydrogenase [Histidinibacterium lentulum]
MRLSLSALALCIAAPALAQDPVDQGAANAAFEPAFEGQTRAPALEDTAVTVETFAEGLEFPWGIAALPEGGFLVTEQPGTLVHVSEDGTVSEPISGVPEVDYRQQGGLLDVAVAEDFAESRRLWLSFSKLTEAGTHTAAVTATLSEDMRALEDVTEIFLQMPASPNPMHFGSRVAPEPGTSNVWITTGEHFSQAERLLAQDLETTYGKVVRVDGTSGAAPEDNPFVGEVAINSIWSYGHRNVQGAAVHPDTGALWTVEHGPRGGDEVNRPEPGENYGWPVISYGINYNGSDVGSGEAVREGMAQPVYYWDPVIAPGGAVFYEGEMFPDWQGDLLIGGLVAAALVRLEVDAEAGRVTGEERVAEGIGRVRDVVVASDGAVLVLIDAEQGTIQRISAE